MLDPDEIEEIIVTHISQLRDKKLSLIVWKQANVTRVLMLDLTCNSFFSTFLCFSWNDLLFLKEGISFSQLSYHRNMRLYGHYLYLNIHFILQKIKNIP